MQSVQIRLYDKPLDIRFTGRVVSLPPALRAKVDAHWQGLLQQNPAYFNGEVFTVVATHEDAQAIHVQLAQTDYAHYAYSSQVGGIGEYAVKLIHPAALVVAGDQLIFGSMGPYTAMPGSIMCCGGGIDHRAVGPDGVVLIEQTMTSELQEELGLGPGDPRVVAMKPTYMTFGGADEKMILVYIVELAQTGEQFLQDYDAYVAGLIAKHVEPEFEKLFCIGKDSASVEAFIKEYESRLNEYMPVVLRAVATAT